MQPILVRATFERPAILLPVALVLIASAAAIIWTAAPIQRRSRPSAITPALSVAQTTVVSAADVRRGQVFRGQDLAVKTLSSSDTPIDSLHRLGEVDGHLALVSIPAGTPILKRDISPEMATGIAALVPQGYRAYAIPVSEADIAGGFLEAGDETDVYVTLPSVLFSNHSIQVQGDHSKAMLLLQDARVLAVGSKLSPGGQPDPSVRTVTLALFSADLPKVALASRLGRISFAIRNPADNQIADGRYAQMTSLLGDEKKREAPEHQIAPGVPYFAGRSRTTLSLP